MNKELSIEIDNKIYPVVIEYKRIKNIYYRFKDTYFYVTCPKFTSDSQVIKGVKKYGLTLIKRTSRRKFTNYDDKYIYILGNKYLLNPDTSFSFSDGTSIKYTSGEDLYKKLKPILLKILTSRVRYYERIMDIEPYNIKVKNMTGRWGSNSGKTRTLNFALTLISYNIDIIDSVVIHELSHDNMYNHSSSFYKKVYKYCPNYDKLHYCLRMKKYNG